MFKSDCKVKKTNALVSMMLSLLLACIVAINALVIHSYVALQQSQPLENFTGHVVNPVYLSLGIIETAGTYDRDIVCRMTDFSVTLTNINNKERVVIGPESLLTAPPSNLNPGKNIPVQFSLAIPTTLYAGIWQVEFSGDYWCRNGLFTARKHQTVTASSIEVLP